jgi:3',5'-cyclic-nucleotide phosphodiesterase
VQVYSSGSACLPRISDLENAAKGPTLVLIDIPPKEARQAWTGHERNTHTRIDSTELGDIYGIKLLSHLGTEIRAKKLSKLIVPIAVIDLPDCETTQPQSPEPGNPDRQQESLDNARFMRLVDAGAVDVLTRPLSDDRVRNLAILGYRMFRDFSKSNTSFLASRRARKMSWVGVEPQKPYSYLREAMVSNLMSGICSPEPDPQFDIWNAMRSA